MRPVREAAATRRMFSQIAGRYDLLNHLLSLNRDRAWRRRACQMAPTEPGAMVLDLGAGTGDLALEYVRQYPRVGRIVLADLAEPMLRLARAKCANHRAARVELACVDALRLPWRTDTFDLVMSAFGVRNFQELGSSLAEMARVARPGGQVLVLEFCRGERAGWAKPVEWFLDGALPRIGQVISAHPSAYQYLRDTMRGFLSPEELCKGLGEAGWEDVRREDLTFGIATAFVGRKPE